MYQSGIKQHYKNKINGFHLKEKTNKQANK